MANKDYVRRGRSPKKPTKKKTSSRPPWRSGLVAIVLAGAFAYGLYLLSSAPEPKHEEAVQPAPVPVKTPQKKEAPLPPPPKEKWDYVETLPNRKIEVTPKKQKVSDIPYVMQCGAYKTMHQAQTRKVDIAFQGLKSKIHKKENSEWYRVVLGPYKTKRDAERDKHKLERDKIECAIWKEKL